MAPASAQTHAHNPASYGAYPECVSLRSRPKVPNQDPRAASGPCLLHVPALQERSPRSPVCEARRRRKDPPVLRPQRPLFASFRPREQTLQERRPPLLPLPGNSAGSSLLHPYLLQQSNYRSEMPIAAFSSGDASQYSYFSATLKSCCISSGVGGAGGLFGSNGRASSRKKL